MQETSRRSTRASGTPLVSTMTELSQSHKLLLTVLAVLAVVAAEKPSHAAAATHRSAASACGKPPAVPNRPAHLRCRLRPNTLISTGLATQIAAGSTVSLRFSSSRGRSRFKCRIDRAAWRACRSPVRFRLPDPGVYRFAVRAIGPYGLTDRTPATLDVMVASQALEPVAGGPGPAVGAAPASAAGVFEPPPAGSGRTPSQSAPFTSHGIWVEPLPPSAPVDPQSPQLIDTLTAKLRDEIADGTGPRLGADTRTPLYRVPAEQPRIPVFLDTGPWGDRLAEKFAAGVPIPPAAQPVAGADRAMAVWQAATDTYWEFFRMQQALHGPQFARSAKVSTGCALQQGTYAYEVTAFNGNGETPAEGGRAGVTVTDGACIEIRWGPIHGATGYRIYRSFDGSAVSYLKTVPAERAAFRDEGTVMPTLSPPPSTNTASTPGEWHAAYGGMVEEASASPGYYRNLVEPTGAVLEQANWGAAATGLPLAAGLITKEDIERGRIDHALAIGLANRSGSSIIRAGSFASPAQRSDGRSPSENSIPEGARLRLDPGLDLTALPLSPFARMIAEAAQRYGMIVQDGSWSTVVYAEDPSPAIRDGLPDFYVARFGRRLSRALRELPWEELEVVRMNLCQRGPCLPSEAW